jgi:hypothetical protein
LGSISDITDDSDNNRQSFDNFEMNLSKRGDCRVRHELPEEKVFKDPVHKYIYVKDRIIWNLINAKEFQRLRRIRQLGTSYLTFHGAEHSRFSHSLGVYEITRRIISQFERLGDSDWPKEERLTALCAALLHDVGHGPFSHSIEAVFDTHHEEWTCRLLLEDTELNLVLRELSDDFPDRIVSVIRRTHGKPIVVSLVTSQLDADRMDFLLRDAYFTGTNYGMFDIDRILRVMRPHKGRIVVKESGMHAVEDYLMSRYQMYWQVYFHPVTRSSEIVLRQIFRRAKELYRDGWRFGQLLHPFRRLFDGEMTADDYFRLDEPLAQTQFMMWTEEKDPLLSDLCRRFLHRRLYKYTTMDELDYPYDLPYHVYRPGGESGPGAQPILLLGEHGELTDIADRSEIVRSLAGIHRGRHHLYYPEDLLLKHRDRLPADIRRLFGMA